MQNNIYKNLTVSALIILLSHICMYNSAIAVFATVLCCAAVAYLTYTSGLFAAVLTCVASLIFNSTVAFFSPVVFNVLQIMNIFASILPGLVCGWCLSKKTGVLTSLFSVTLSFVIFPIILLAYIKYIGKFDISAYLGDVIVITLNKYYSVIKSVYPDIVQLIGGNETDLFAALGIYIPGIIPVFIIAISFVFAVLTFSIGKHFCQKAMILNSHFIDGLGCFAMPKLTSLALLISFVIMTFGQDTFTNMMFLNTILIIFMLYAFEGLSFIDYKLKQRNFNFLIRLIFLFAILFALTMLAALIPFINPILVLSLIGMLDSIHDFRKLGINKGEYHEN